MDTWIVLANDDVGGHHRRGLYVLKSRGMRHSNELREFVLTDQGLEIFDGNGLSGGTPNGPAHGSQEGRDRHAVV
jgi:circadian clock protein KaiC